MVKSETRRDAKTLVWKSKPETQAISEPNKTKTSLRDSVGILPRFRDGAKIFRDPRFSGYHLPPLRVEPPSWTRLPQTSWCIEQSWISLIRSLLFHEGFGFCGVVLRHITRLMCSRDLFHLVLYLFVISGQLVRELKTSHHRRGAGVFAVKWETPSTLLSCGYDTAVRLWDTRLIDGWE